MTAFDCDQVLTKVYDYLHGELAEDERSGIEQHLPECSDCSKEYALESTITAKIRASSWNQVATEILVERAFMQAEKEE
jgi:anti-sigma factor (TIGR02949 family)